ncbi:MAG TPA: cytochrome b N-terminal domain-containing protein [Chloroflexota bacterium]
MNALIRFGDATYKWLDERLGIGMVWKATALHYVPKSVNWWYVFGSALLTVFTMQLVTGIFLAMTYVPSPDHAYSSLDYISHHQFAGNLLRGLHYWGASAMVLLIFIHMTANFLLGSYKYPRELQWLTGSVLLLLTLLMAFTGQLLRWNQDAYWAIVVGAEQAARTPIIGQWVAELLTLGPTVSGKTLTFYYALHMLLLPGGIITFISIHLYLVIYKGISEWPVPGRPVDPKTYWAEYEEILHKDGEPFFPVAIYKDAVMSLLVIVVIGALAIHGATNLGIPANPATPANPAPDWYLIWYFAVLALIGVDPNGPAITPWVIILFPAIAFGILFLFPLANKGERHYARRPWAIATVVIAAGSTLVLIYIGYSEPWKPILVNATTPPQLAAKSLRTTTGAPLPPLALAGGHLMSAEACTACHQIDGVGGHRGPDLSRVGDQLSAGQMIWRIARGGGGMPAYGNVLNPKQVNQLVAYLETRVTPGQASGSTGH